MWRWVFRKRVWHPKALRRHCKRLPQRCAAHPLRRRPRHPWPHRPPPWQVHAPPWLHPHRWLQLLWRRQRPRWLRAARSARCLPPRPSCLHPHHWPQHGSPLLPALNPSRPTRWPRSSARWPTRQGRQQPRLRPPSRACPCGRVHCCHRPSPRVLKTPKCPVPTVPPPTSAARSTANSTEPKVTKGHVVHALSGPCARAKAFGSVPCKVHQGVQRQARIAQAL